MPCAIAIRISPPISNIIGIMALNDAIKPSTPALTLSNPASVSPLNISAKPSVTCVIEGKNSLKMSFFRPVIVPCKVVMES